ncbi:MAG TPA: AI-2E family transporter, partial [Nakamurella sp.]|nr:AI-2E family transporter [Nakamurella sp.]
LRRGGAVATVFLALLAVIAAAIYAIVPPIVNEVGSFVGSVPQLIESLQENPTIQNLDQRFQLLDALRNSNIVQNVGSGAAGGLLTASVTVASVFLDLVIILILTLYFLAGFPRIKAAAYRLVPATRRPRVVELSDRVLKQMGGYLSGATIIAIQAGLIAGIFAFIIGLPYPWAIALGAAVLDFIPVVGPIIIGVSMTLLGFTQSLAIGIIAGVFYLCQHLFEAYWLYPRVMRRTVEISTGAVVVAILIGASLLGVTGAILAVPVAAAIMLIVREVIMPMQERS